MEETRQIEVSEIVESASISPDDSLLVVFPPSRPCESIAAAAEQSRISLLKLAPGEIAFRRSLAQIIDFSIVYGGMFFYFFHSSLILNRGTQDLIHPLAVNLSVLDGWQLLGLLFLLPLPYMYYFWYFKEFTSSYTPGEGLVGIARVDELLESGNSRRHLLYALCQFLQSFIALAWALIAATPYSSLIGAFLLFVCRVIGVRSGDWFHIAMYLTISGLFWFPLLFGGLGTAVTAVLSLYVCLASPLTIFLLVLYRENQPVDDDTLQSLSDSRYGMSSRTIRNIRKHFYW